MIDLSLHIYDIAQNAVDAGARNIKIVAWKVGFIMEDDGCGMEDEVLAHACDERFTTRISGHGGRGLHLLSKNAKDLEIKSQKEVGTKICARFSEDFPVGNIARTIKLLKHCYPDIRWQITVYETKEELCNENA